MTGSTIRRGFLVFITLMLAIALLVFSNPCDMFTLRSSNFSVNAFKTIEPGHRIGSVIALLGQPIRIVEDVFDCADCKSYLFLGDPPRGAVCYTEAWVGVGPDGVVK